jgi:capsule biosynthesis phosphatase
MKVFIVCNNLKECNYSYIHPFNQINIHPSIYYTVKYLPNTVSEINIIYNKDLDDNYNFRDTIQFILRDRKCNFILNNSININFNEYMNNISNNIDINDKEPLLFIESRIVYRFLDFDENIFNNNTFVGINNGIFCGIYGFKNIDILKHYTKHHKTINSFIRKTTQITFDDILYVDTLDNIKNNIEHLKPSQMRFCFDLDNTLVTPPSVLRDYSTVQPIYKMINLAKKLKNDGHIIIIHTARKMLSNSHNTGAAIANIAKLTIETLDKFEIPYDELIFGKPYADIYIDDKAYNQYVNTFESIGLIT